VSSDNREISNTETTLNLDDSSDKFSEISQDQYMQLQLRIYRLTLIITAVSVLICTIFFDSHSGFSLFIGALSGIFYLRLLARGIGKLGKSSMSVSKVQLLVPVLLFFSVSRLPELELLPALLGFLLYKLSLIIQFSLEP
tara:strand:- start:91 stop:510 length:420 start_codon:yes stop_codon:yes gene_type:complete